MDIVCLEAVEFKSLDSGRVKNGFKLIVPGFAPYFHDVWVNRASMDDMEFLTDVVNVMEANWGGYEKNMLQPLFKQIVTHKPDMLIGGKRYNFEEYGYILRRIIWRK